MHYILYIYTQLITCWSKNKDISVISKTCIVLNINESGKLEALAYISSVASNQGCQSLCGIQ